MVLRGRMDQASSVEWIPYVVSRVKLTRSS